jgi:hypothetical protein
MNDQTLFCYQSATFEENILVLADDFTPINITGYTFIGAIRKDTYSVNESANLIINIVSATNGQANMYLDSINTANLVEGSYLYSVEMKDLSNNWYNITQGTFIVVPSATVQQPTPAPVYPLVLNDTFYALAGQNSFYLSFAPANTSNVTIIYNNVTLANSNTIYTLNGEVLVFANSANQGDVIVATTTLPVGPNAA